MRRKAAFALFTFAVAMACFAMLARAVDAAGVAQVKTVNVGARTIAHKVQAQGVVAFRGETAVLTEAGQVVSAPFAREGDTVQAGEALFAVDAGVLDDGIERASVAVRKLDIDIASMRDAAAAAVATGANDAGSGDAAASGAAAGASIESLELDRRLQQTTLDRLVALRDAGGEVLAPHSGTVASVLAPVGSMTSTAAVLTLANPAIGLVVEATATGGDIEDLGSEAVGTVRFSDDLVLQDVVFSIARDADGGARLSANVDAKGVTAGMTCAVTVDLSSSEYATCLPLEALHQEGPSRFSVYVVEDREGFLGTEQVARSVSVTVLDTGDGYAALADGALSARQQAIVRSDKVIAEGDKVRALDA